MRFSVLIFFAVLSFQGWAQLPEKWLGHYEGELTSLNLAGNESSYGMELIISARNDSSYNFTIIYGIEDTKQERAYLLIPDGKNHFLLDELNGIVIDMSLGNDRLVSVFEVKNSFLHVSYILTNNGLRFELTSSNPGVLSGGIETESEEKIPEVQSYKTVAFQFAILKRKKK